jgi:hypothetical protein
VPAVHILDTSSTVCPSPARSAMDVSTVVSPVVTPAPLSLEPGAALPTTAGLPAW